MASEDGNKMADPVTGSKSAGLQGSNLQRRWLLVLVAAATLLFLWIVAPFLKALFVAVLLAAISYPLFERMVSRWKLSAPLAAGITTVLVLLFVLVPAVLFLAVLVSQAISVGSSAGTWIQQMIQQPGKFQSWLQDLPYGHYLVPYQQEILSQASKAAAALGGRVVETAAMFTKEAANLVLMMFVTIYAVFFFLVDGKYIMDKAFYYSPLDTADERMLVERFMAVSKATLKTCFLLGVLQGGLNGIAFAVAGIPSSLFWATCMAVLSVIPGIGAALVYVPASIVLIVQGHAVKGLVLLGFCGLVVGSLDNVLRPKLVGRDTRLPQLAVLVGTLGGIALFGMIGILVGPIAAALWLVLMELYGNAFKQELPPVRE